MAFGQSAWVLVICLVIAVVFVTVKGNPEPSATASCTCQPGTMTLENEVDNIRSVMENAKDILKRYKTEIGLRNKIYKSNLRSSQQVLRLSEATSLAAPRSNCLLNMVEIIDSIRSRLSLDLLQKLDNQLSHTRRMSCNACNRLTQIDCIYSNNVNGGDQLAIIINLRDIYMVTCEMVRRANSSAPACNNSDL